MKMVAYAVFIIVFMWTAPAIAGTDKAVESCSAIAQRVGTDVGLPDFSFPRDGLYPSKENGGLIVSGECKPWPLDHSKTLAAFAYDDGVEFEKVLVVALVQRKKVLATYVGRYNGDATTEFTKDSLTLDTKGYKLSKNTTAFGLLINSFRDRCSYDGGFDSELTLFVVEPPKIRPVLSGIYMDVWHRTGPSCTLGTKITSVLYSLSVSPSTTNGFHDLLITGQRSDGVPVPVAQLQYNGTRYPHKAFNDFLW